MLTVRIWAVVFIFILVLGAFGYYSSTEESKEAFIDKIALPYRLLNLALEPPDTELILPIRGISVSDVDDTFGDPRPGWRKHEGIDIFAKRGTPVYSATPGYVIRMSKSGLGGNYVMTMGAAGRRYYYAHLDSFAKGLRVGDKIGTDTVLGYVGNTGNASTTPPHLHFGAYGREPINPYSLFVVVE